MSRLNGCVASLGHLGGSPSGHVYNIGAHWSWAARLGERDGIIAVVPRYSFGLVGLSIISAVDGIAEAFVSAIV